MYFQWGRKDPLTAASGFTSSPWGHNVGISLTYAASHPMVMGNYRRLIIILVQCLMENCSGEIF